MSDSFPNVHFIKLDVDENPEVAHQLDVTAMPTFIIFKGGERVDTIVGANPRALLASIEKQTNAQAAPIDPQSKPIES
jgi:thioredoxin 1